MHIRGLLTDDDAVSSVVSTVLMVAITIILVAVIGSFVLNLSGAVSETAPSTSLSVRQESMPGGNYSVIVEHEGGDVMSKSQISVTVDGSTAFGGPGATCNEVWSGTGDISAGDTANVSGTTSNCFGLSPGQKVEVVWTSENGEQSFSLVDYTVE